jgi:hypothetical protein
VSGVAGVKVSEGAGNKVSGPPATNSKRRQLCNRCKVPGFEVTKSSGVVKGLVMRS